MVTRASVIEAYRLILGREPESEAAIEAHSRIENIDMLRRALLSSIEFGSKHADLLSRLPCILNFREEWAAATRRYYDAIEGSGVALDRVGEIYAAAGLSQDQYTLQHLRRFRELFAYLVARFGQTPSDLKVLEIGTSAHTTPIYRNFLRAEFDTICRPTDLGGPNQQWAAAAGSRNHWEIDLNYPERHGEIIEQIPQSHYDVVICCEVIEHLTKPPRDLITFALSRMKQNGFLYLTTPNFLTPEKLNLIYAGRSPVAGFLEYDDNFHAHHHFREYTVGELLDEVAAARGVASEVILSDCWDYPKYGEGREIMFRSNIVMIVGHASGQPRATSPEPPSLSL